MTEHIAKRPPEELFNLVTDRWSAPFWEAAARHRLTVPKCASCGTFRMPPTPFCPECLSQDLEWPELTGRGVIYSYTIVTRALFPEMAASIPYVPAVIELDDAGGCRLISNIVDVPLDAMRIGAGVRVVWEDRSDGVTVPRFTLTDQL